MGTQKYLVIVFFLFIAFGNSYAQTGVEVPELENVDQDFQQFMKDWNVPGASISVVRQGKLVYSRGFGFADTTSKELVQPDHLFRIASISKSITSIALMTLIEQDLVGIDDSVFGPNGILNDEQYLTIQDDRVLTITLRQLLHHTSGWGILAGIGDPMFLNQYIANQIGAENRPVGVETTISYLLANQDLQFDPGSTYNYSNFGYAVLGRVIEKLTGENYENYVRNLFEAKLGITTMKLGKNLLGGRFENEVVYYDYPKAPMANSVYGDGKIVPWPYAGFNLEAMDSHGGWVASGEDLLKIMLSVDSFSTFEDILEPETITLMTTPSQQNQNYALGWGVNLSNNWWHAGSLPGTTSILVKTGNGYGWAVLLNTRDANINITNEVDALMWNMLGNVTSWPEHDLFEETTTTTETNELLPSNFSLYQNYPNPFNPETTIQFSLPVSSKVQLTVYNVLGHEIVRLVDGNRSAGNHNIRLNASNLSSGLYYYTLKTDLGVLTRKMTLIK
ncbi:MAG: hypothetical protein BalsKO_00660 [Balneolaceae bacterium]